MRKWVMDLMTRKKWNVYSSVPIHCHSVAVLYLRQVTLKSCFHNVRLILCFFNAKTLA